MPKHKTFGKSAAVALKYNPDLNYAPIVVASGMGELAKKILSIADDSAAALLVMLGAGEHVPPELYKVVAAIYAQVVYDANDLKKMR